MKIGMRDRAFIVFSYAFVVVFSLFCLLPFWIMIIGSFTKESELVLHGYALFPKILSFTAYELLFQSKILLNSYKITILITCVGSVLGLCISSMLAYSIANKRNRLRDSLSFYVYFTMLFNGGIVPLYIIVSRWLHLSNSIWVLILPLAIQPFLVFLLVSFFKTIPAELEDAGRIDGANEMRIFFQIIIPISKPILATVFLFYALLYWNDWFMGIMFIDEEKYFPLQLILRRMVSNFEAAKRLIPSGASIALSAPTLQIRMATTLITIGPIILLYPFLQKYFVKGLTIGSTKG